MKKIEACCGLLAAGAMFFAESSWGATTGFVTPSEMTITFTSLRLVRPDNSQLTLLSGNFAHTFRRTDADFAAVKLDGITAPAGRFMGVQLCYNTDRSVKLNGDKYFGSTTGSYTDNSTLLYSQGSNALAANSIATSAPSSGATTMTGYVVGNGSSNCSTSYFANPVCITSDAGKCQSNDIVVKSSINTPPNINILLDMYHAVGVNASSNTLEGSVPIYPYPTIGQPGAAIHLRGTSTTHANVSLLFGPDKRLLYASSYASSGASQAFSGFCTGNNFVSVTAAPSGSFMNEYGPTSVLSFNSASTTRQVQFVAGNCGSGSTACTSNGMVTIDKVLVAVGTAVTVTCVADSAADPTYLGYAYTGGGGSPGSVSFQVKRIIDPSGLFQTSTLCTGTCGTYE